MNNRHSKYNRNAGSPVCKPQQGFTLLELLIALTVFALFTTMAYQSIVQIWDSQRRLSTSAEQLAQRSSAFSVLNRFIIESSGVTGTPTELVLNRDTVDLAAISGPSIRQVRIDNGTLFVDEVALMSGLSNALFTYRHQSQVASTWTQVRPPELIELTWTSVGRQQRWQFALR